MKKLLCNVPMIVCIFGVMNAYGQCYVCGGGTCNGVSAAGNCSFAAGENASSNGVHSIAVGRWVTANDADAQVYGLGLDPTTTGSELINDIPRTMMFGMNSDVPTLFLDNSGGTSGSWGNVGIGNITAPASLLHVRDQIRVGLTAIGGDAGAGGSLLFNNAASNTITFNTPASMGTQSYTLPTAVGVNGDVLTYTTGGQLTWGSGGTATDDWRLDGNNNATASSKLGTLNNQPLMVYAYNAERMRVTTAGNVGIGTATPGARLHVQAAPAGHEQFLHLTVDDAALPGNANYLRILNYTGTADELGFMVEARNSNSGTVPALTINGVLDQSVDMGSTAPVMTFNVRKVNTSGSIANRPLFSWHNDGTAKMRMNAAGNLGIGTTTPGSKLTVAGDIAPSANNAYNLGTSTANRWNTLYYSTLVQGSDDRIKENIQPLQYGLEHLLQLEPISYELIPPVDSVGEVVMSAIIGTQFGLSAQSLQEVLPQLVKADGDSMNLLGVRYVELIPILINAIIDWADNC